MAKQSKNSVANIELQLYEKGKAIAMLTENDSINKEAIASLSDQLDELMGEIDNGYPPEKIIEFAKNEQVDLIVIGSVGLSELSKVKALGSVSRSVSERAICPVLIVH
jgi:nucleotide-binding universal stress UspA family protein